MHGETVKFVHGFCLFVVVGGGGVVVVFMARQP